MRKGLALGAVALAASPDSVLVGFQHGECTSDRSLVPRHGSGGQRDRRTDRRGHRLRVEFGHLPG